MDSGDLLSVAETAKLLQRSTEQVRRYLREGVLPGRRIGGQWFIDRSSAETLLTRRTTSNDFHGQLATSDPDPLGLVIAIGGSGGADIATGRTTYLRSLTALDFSPPPSHRSGREFGESGSESPL